MCKETKITFGCWNFEAIEFLKEFGTTNMKFSISSLEKELTISIPVIFLLLQVRWSTYRLLLYYKE